MQEWVASVFWENNVRFSSVERNTLDCPSIFTCTLPAPPSRQPQVLMAIALFCVSGHVINQTSCSTREWRVQLTQMSCGLERATTAPVLWGDTRKSSQHVYLSSTLSNSTACASCTQSQKSTDVVCLRCLFAQVLPLNSMCKAGAVGGAETRPVFVGSLCSENSGNAFVEAGVAHVVAVKKGRGVSGEVSAVARCCRCCCHTVVVFSLSVSGCTTQHVLGSSLAHSLPLPALPRALPTAFGHALLLACCFSRSCLLIQIELPFGSRTCSTTR